MSIVGKQSKEEKCPTLRPEGLRIGQELTLYPIARLNWTGVQLTNSIKDVLLKVDSQVELNTLLLLSYPAVHDQLSTRIPYLEDRPIRGLTER